MKKKPSGRPMDDYLRKVQALVKRYGWAAQGVFPAKDEDGPGFIYTVGLTAKAMPELVISGIFLEQGKELINIAATQHLENEMKPGDTNENIANVAFRVIHAPLAEIGVAKRLYGDKAKAIQLCWPDADGSWPPFERQELFGPTWWKHEDPITS